MQYASFYSPLGLIEIGVLGNALIRVEFVEKTRRSEPMNNQTEMNEEVTLIQRTVRQMKEYF
jgi:hypothetical protein